MKKYLRAFVMSMSMFSVIPCPFRMWDEESRPLMTLALPFVGTVIGGLWALTAYVCGILGIPLFLKAAVLCAFPYVITGGMHMDGFLDVTDAVRSWRDVEERRRILKDPHVGSFAVIDAILLVMVQFAAFCSLRGTENILTLILIPTVSRCIAAFCVTVLPPLTTSEYSGSYRDRVRRSHVVFLTAVTAVAAVLGFVFLGRCGYVSLAVAAGYLLYMFRAYKSLGGMSGDISGYALTFAELCGIIAFVLI
ncbi:MAG: adenosylcobinamide-GDP ribazoletransferase [Oscillospiraceae bacterium]|nr:adenosylcobinamide-GDP ribazoletransferase [Oscillospiraceae bacterium]